jgi:hypothetical protein
LMRYEHKIVREFNDALGTCRIDPAFRAHLAIRRPFEFTFPRILGTASFLFLLYTLVLSATLLRNAFR